MIKKNFFYYISAVLLFFLLISVFFLPVFLVKENWPTVHGADFILLFISVFLILYRRNVYWKKYYNLLVVYAAIIIISITINYRNQSISDLFEILKIVKFALIIAFTSISIRYFNLKRFLNIAFVILVCINFLQFFELFHINYILVELYGYEQEVLTFGKNTIGEPATKRMFGLMGNPNNNAIIFLFFISVFFRSGTEFRSNWRFYLAIFMMFLCQSKIAVLAFIVILPIGFVYYRHSKNSIFKKVGIIILLSILSLSLNGSYIIIGLMNLVEFIFFGTQNQENANLSVSGRWEVWTMLFEMIIQKPIIGYGPYKEYFYVRDLYSENEYILVWWRYGLLGLLSFISLLLYPIVIAINNIENKYTLPTILFSIVILITALTNNPMSNRDIQALYAILLGAYFSQHLNAQIKPQEPNKLN